MLRAQLTGRVCHRVNDEASAKMALGDIAPEAAAAACAIAPERPGLAVAGDTSERLFPHPHPIPAHRSLAKPFPVTE